MITSFEVDEKVLRELETIAPLPNDYRDGGSVSNLNEPNLTQKPLTSQEVLLKTTENTQKTTQEPKSALELANAEKLAKLESERLEMDKRSSKQKECREDREPIYIKAEIDKADIIHSFIP
ncbi:hypothetical protein oki114_03990 [Helicobacter pylori]|nr:hypothetical protein JP0524_05520 [Helicobacter pylori]